MRGSYSFAIRPLTFKHDAEWKDIAFIDTTFHAVIWFLYVNNNYFNKVVVGAKLNTK